MALTSCIWQPQRPRLKSLSIPHMLPIKGVGMYGEHIYSLGCALKTVYDTL